MLEYKCIPCNRKEAKLYPTIILLHGRGTDENDLVDLASVFDDNFSLFSLRAPYKFLYGGYTWFDIDKNGEVNVEQIIKSRDLIIHSINHIKNEYHVDMTKIFLFGFSMGAMMSLVCSLSDPDLFKGVVVHSGMLALSEKLNYEKHMVNDISFFIAHGQYDDIVPIELGRKTVQILKEFNLDITYREYPIGHHISEESINDILNWLKGKIN